MSSSLADEVELDPDKFALAVVQQYLKEHGYRKALTALEQEAGVIFVEEKLRRGSQLLEMVYERVEAKLAASSEEGQQHRKQRLEEMFLQPGAKDYPQRLAATAQLEANVICLVCWPAERKALAGLGNGSVAVVDYEGRMLGSASLGNSGVLCAAVRPCSNGCLSSVAAVGCMDGRVWLVDSSAVPSSPPRPCASVHPHRKYVVAAKWSPDGAYLVTASWDGSFAVFRAEPQSVAAGAAAAATAAADMAAAGGAAAIGCEAAVGGAAAAGGAATNAAACAGGEQGDAAPATALRLVHQEQCGAQVQAVEFLPGHGGRSFLVAVRGSNYLRQYSIAAAGEEGLGAPSSSEGSSSGGGSTGAGGSSNSGGGPAVREERRLNMNAIGDDYVSFSACHLAVSPCGEFLLVSADNGRLILYDIEGWEQMRNFYGLPTEQFHQFVAAWHASGLYIMAAAAAGWMYTFNVGSAKVEDKVKAHDKNCRNLCYDAANNILLTCSFDRSVRVFGR